MLPAALAGNLGYYQSCFSRGDGIVPLVLALQLLQKQKRAIEGIVLGLSSERLSYRKNASTWTVVEILDHLRKVDAAFAKEMSASRTSIIKVSPAERLKGFLLIAFMFLPVKVRIPTGAPVEPDSVADPITVLARWNETREGLVRIISDLTAERYSGAIIRHPVSGWMGVNAATWFLVAHTIHHRYQLRRVLH